jgi:hypothetical protein
VARPRDNSSVNLNRGALSKGFLSFPTQRCPDTRSMPNSLQSCKPWRRNKRLLRGPPTPTFTQLAPECGRYFHRLANVTGSLVRHDCSMGWRAWTALPRKPVVLRFGRHAAPAFMTSAGRVPSMRLHMEPQLVTPCGYAIAMPSFIMRDPLVARDVATIG